MSSIKLGFKKKTTSKTKWKYFRIALLSFEIYICIIVWWEKKGYCSDMSNVVSAIDELYMRYKFHPMNPNKTYFQQTNYFH
jgi:hypothetical protein